ncbi:MAG: serine/threonine-protein kinase [Burkholderiales bacterium]
MVSLSAAQERAALALFDAAFDHAAVARDAWLVAQCGDDAALLARVRDLLATDAADSSGFLSAPAGGTFVPGGASDWATVMPPSQIGVYRLDELIGSGGMGSVYRASRNDGLFEQTVAIKFVRPLRGLVQVEPLVDAERRLLARMQHPAIAHILDGGTTANGLHFLVMEFVDGVALDEHAQTHGLGVRERVALLREVFAAVAHAHQHLVLHCDIKPANILVTEEGRPKLIDFGVARIQDVVDASLPQGFTRAYTSPQRLAGEPAAVTDDVYSLGMVLGELLTGELPDPQTLAFAGAALDDELAAIVRKALAPERAQRYGTVDTFEDELRRWLACRPVLAMGSDWRYRTRKLVQRHPWRVASGALALGGLVTALVVTTSLYTRAEAARRDAEKRFAEVRSLANYMLFDLDERLESTPGNTQARRELVGRSQQYLDALGATAGNNPELQREVALGLVRLAEVQGGWGVPNVGEAERARSTFERAESMLAALVRQQPGQWAWRGDLGRVQYRLADFYGSRDGDAPRQLAKAREAEGHLVLALAAASGSGSAIPLAGPSLAPARPKELADLEVLLSSARLAQAFALDYNADHQAAAAIARAEESRMAGLPEAVRKHLEADYRIGRPSMQLGDSLYYAGNFTEAQAAYRRGLARFAQGLVESPRHRRLLESTALAHWSLAAVLDELGRHAEALAEIDAGLPIAEQLVALDASNVHGLRVRSTLRNQRAETLGQLGRYDEAIAITEANQREREERVAKAPDDAEPARDAAVPLMPLAALFWAKGDAAAACRLMRQSDQAWTTIDRRWGLSELDRQQQKVSAQLMATRCPG